MEEELKETPQVNEEEKDALPQEDVVSKPEETKVDELDKTNDVIKEDENSRPYEEVIEEARVEIKDAYSKQRRISNIVMLVVVAFMVGCFVLILQKLLVLNIIGYSVMGALVVFMIVFYFLTKNKLPNKIRDYINLVTLTINSHIFKDGAYSEVKSDPTDRLEIGERNVVEGMFGGRHFKVADVALRKGSGKQTQNLFIGKYLSYPNNLHFEGRYVILSKRPNAETDIPNAISDLFVLSEEEGFVIYGPKEDAKIAKDLNTKFASLIKAIAVEKELLNLVVVIWAGHSAAYLSYSDSIIALPFEKPFEKDGFEQYSDQQLQLLNALKTLL